MLLTIATPTAATHVPNATPSSDASAPSKPATDTAAKQLSASSGSAAQAQQQAALNRLLAKYTYDQSHGADSNTLSTLAKQIKAAAKALGRNVSLPNAPSTPNPGSASSSPTKTPGTRKIDLTA